VGDFAKPRDFASGQPELAAVQGAEEVRADLNIPANQAGDPAQSRTVRVRDWEEFPIPVFSSLGLATVFTLNAVLSQPIAGFDYLTSRLDAIRRPLIERKDRRR
jgi:hypothetical protein